MWWKKMLAVISLPLSALLLISNIETVVRELHKVPMGNDAYRIGYGVGFVLASCFVTLLIFFLARWSIRTLFRSPEH